MTQTSMTQIGITQVTGNKSDGSQPMARDERPEDITRGGVGTITRSGVRQRPVPAPRQVPGRRTAPERRAVPGQRATGSAPNVTAVPNAQAAPNVQAAPSARPAGSVAGHHRMPFVLLLCGLLGGALVSALVISTTLAEGSFEITRLQDSTSALARQRQALEEEVAQAQSAQVIATRAQRLGMEPVGELRFVDLKTGKTSSDAATGWEATINVPGYTP